MNRAERQSYSFCGLNDYSQRCQLHRRTGKVRDYLLNLSHPAGKSKAAFFTAMGFRQQDWEALAAALRQMVCRSPLTIRMTSRQGQKYIVDGTLVTPIGQMPLIRTVWVIDSGTDRPRLVTAYPMDQEPRS